MNLNNLINLEKSISRKIILFLFFLLSFYFYFSPYTSIFRFKYNLDSQNYGHLEKFINFNSLRIDLKNQLRQIAINKISTDTVNNPWPNIGILLVTPLINRIVDNTITPEGLKLLINSGSLSTPSLNSANNPQNPSSPRSSPKTALYYKSLNYFILKSNFSDSNQIITLWKRENIFHWRLISIKVPDSILRSR